MHSCTGYCSEHHKKCFKKTRHLSWRSFPDSGSKEMKERTGKESHIQGTKSNGRRLDEAHVGRHHGDWAIPEVKTGHTDVVTRSTVLLTSFLLESRALAAFRSLRRFSTTFFMVLSSPGCGVARRSSVP